MPSNISAGTGFPSRGRVSTNPLAPRVEEGLARNLPFDPAPEDLDRHSGARVGVLGRHVRVGNRAAQGVAVAARGDATADLAVDLHRFVAERDRARIREQQAGKPSARATILRLQERLPANAPALLVELHAEAHPALIWRLVWGDVGSPDPVALLEAHRVDRPVAAADDPVRLPLLPDRAPEPEPVLGGAVELPAELADIGDAERPHGHVPDGDLVQRHVRELLVAEVCWGKRLQHIACPRPPDPEAGPLRGRVVDLDAAVAGNVAADPFAIVVAEGRAGDDREAIAGEARDGEVTFDPAAAVEHLRVGDLLRLAGYPVVTQTLEELGCPGSLDFHLRERALVEDGHPIPRGLVLGADRRGPVLAGPAPRAQRLVPRLGVRFVPVDPFPT